MGLQGLLESIRASGEAQLRELEGSTSLQLRETQVEADAQASEAKEEARQTASVTAGAERARILHLARLEALHNLGTVRESLIEASLDQVRGWLRNLRTDQAYPLVLRQLVDEALANIRNSTDEIGKICLDADPQDRALLSGILADKGLKLIVDYSLDSWGGVIVRSEDGRIVVINTLETRLERATPYLRHYLAAFYENDLSLPESGPPEVKTPQLTR